MGNLVKNEVIKVLYKKKLHVIAGILMVLIGLFAYGEQYTLSRTQDQVAEQFGLESASDWRRLSEQQLSDIERRLENPYIPEEGRASLMVRSEQLKFYLENDVSPINSSAARFMGRFLEQSIFLFLPLMIIILASDMVSGEVNTGTIKMLMTRPVKRWKILMSKLLALAVLEMLVIILIALIGYFFSMLVFRYGGFNEPVITGFGINGNVLDTSNVITIPQWQFLIMVYALGYLVSFVIGALALMVSVLVRSTAASIGIMMSMLIGGSFLGFFIADWKITRYLFTVNLNLVGYLTGTFQRIEGLNMAFSAMVLLGWTLAALVTAFAVFVHKDILA